MEPHFILDEYLEKNREVFEDIIRTVEEKPRVYDRDAAFLRRFMLASMDVARERHHKHVNVEQPKFVEAKPIHPFIMPQPMQQLVQRPHPILQTQARPRLPPAPAKPMLPSLDAPAPLKLELEDAPEKQDLPELNVPSAPSLVPEVPKLIPNIPKPVSQPIKNIPEAPKSISDVPDPNHMPKMEDDIPGLDMKSFIGEIPKPKKEKMDVFSNAPNPY